MSDLACIGSNHIPNHSPDCPRSPGWFARLTDIVERPALPSGAAIEEAWAPAVASVTPVAASLTMALDVAVTRIGRARCPLCRRRRVLLRLSAWSSTQPVGYGQSKCLECAGLRRG